MTKIREVIVTVAASDSAKKDATDDLEKKDPTNAREIIELHRQNISDSGKTLDVRNI
jgi:hypothetical protein